MMPTLESSPPFSFYKVISPFLLFSRKTNEEFRQVVNGYRHQKHKKGRLFQEPLMLQIPKVVDWREKGCVTPVKNQGHSNAHL